jgi:hypothetical protein
VEVGSEESEHDWSESGLGSERFDLEESDVGGLGLEEARSEQVASSGRDESGNELNGGMGI